MNFLHWLNYNIIGRMTGAFKLPVQKVVIIFGLSDSKIVFTKLFLQSSTSLSNILHITIYWWFLLFYVLVFKFFVLLSPYVCYHIFS